MVAIKAIQGCVRHLQYCSPADADMAAEVVSLFMSLSCLSMFRELKYDRD